MKEIINNHHLKMDTDKELLTIRDHFAATALNHTHIGSPTERAEWAYAVADAMMKERTK